MDRLSARDRKRTLRTEQRAVVCAQPPQSVRFFETLRAVSHHAPLSTALNEREKNYSFTVSCIYAAVLPTGASNKDTEHLR